MTGVEAAREVADAVLYEGYLLYPYRASAAKNQHRFQFGVLLPPAYAAVSGEHATIRTECLLEADPAAVVHARLRFLQLSTRPAAAGEWDEAQPREVDLVAPVAELLGEGRATRVAVPGGADPDPAAGGAPRVRQELAGELRLRAEQLPGPYRLLRLRAEVVNTSTWSVAQPSREQALRHSLVATHTLLAVNGGGFLSLLDPPEWARAAAQECQNLRTWPVLVGEPGDRQVLLSSPIILYDYPRVAPESPGDWFDCTEIDELLSLRTLALTDAEKQAARATDPRAAELIDRVEQLPPELLARLHGAIRSVSPAGGSPAPEVPDSVEVAGHRLARGSRVRLWPGGSGGADGGAGSDAQDMFLVGRAATVQEVRHDVDGRSYLAVTLDDDPGADLHAAHGRFRYFEPAEVEPLAEASTQPGAPVAGPGPTGAPACGPAAPARVLVAGIGNIFLGDDGFGVELARRLAEVELPPGVRVVDYGIGGMRLAYDLLDGGYHTTVLLDAIGRGESPGTVSVLSVDPAQTGWDTDDQVANAGRYVDAHGMQPDQVLALLRTLGGDPGRVLVVGCEPAVTEPGIGLSEPVQAAVGRAVTVVRDLLTTLTGPAPEVSVGEESR